VQYLQSTTAPLQRAQNAAARLIARLSPYDHVTSTVRQGQIQDLPRWEADHDERG